MLPRDFPEIRALPLFRGVEGESFESLMRGAYLQTFPEQIELVREGDPSDFLHIVIDGMVETFATWNGRETVMQMAGPSATFILAATICDAPYLMSARTVARSRIVLIPSHDVRTIFDTDPSFARCVVRELASCYRGVVKHTKNIKLRNTLERLANYLLQQKKAAGDHPAFELPVEKRKLAAYLGMTPENLSRALRNLEAYGVTCEGSTIRISDSHDLVILAKPQSLIDDPAL